MNNLFSVFEPSAIGAMPFNWASSVLILILPAHFWFTPSTMKNFILKLTHSVHAELTAILNANSLKGLSLTPITMFLMILTNNSLGLFPYIFTSSSHLVFCFTLAFPLWIGHILMGWAFTPNMMLAHLVPLGTPAALMPGMVLIELLSNIIRPFTLTVRLTANMIAGHLLLSLLSSQAQNLTLPYLSALFIALLALMVLESAVAMIQAYVFSVLSTLYFNEINSKALPI